MDHLLLVHHTRKMKDPKRFDRDDSRNRIHLMSAMTALGMTDGNTDGASYLDLAGQIEQMSATPDKDLRELWKRMVFNVLTSNCDDHLRNHGFILREDGWHLSPAFDLNPNIQKDAMSLNITDNDNRKNVCNAISVSELFRVPEGEAKEIVQNMQALILDNWKQLASQYRIPEKDMAVMASAFRECNREIIP
jgi:serine/threonine-protein kinase HipA